jgi:transcription-repair coupling factor (superfamily II helicase)
MPSLQQMANEQLGQLLSTYRSDDRVSRLVKHAASKDAVRIHVDSTVGSQRAFVIAAMFQEAEAPIIAIANDKEEAAYLFNDLENLLVGRRVLFLPDSFKRPGAYEDLNPDNALQRTEVVNQLAQGGALVVVTYPEALFEMVVDPQALDAKRIDVKIGEDLDVDTLIELLIEFGFERADFVAKPGEFSIRGGIVDVYSYANEYPYRIELFDEEVETIRTFDPGDQLSKANIGRVSIVPNVNTKFNREDKTSIFGVLPEDTSVWIKDYQFFLDRLQLAFEKAITFGETVSSLDQSELAELMRTRAFLRPPEVLGEIQGFNLFFLKKPPPPIRGIAAESGSDSDVGDGVVAGFSVSDTITFNASPQPSVNRNFNLLLENFQKNEKLRFETYLFVSDAKQVERFYAIFKDISEGVEVHWHPIVQPIHEGFIDPDLKLAVYTDHQIFERYHRYKLRKGFAKADAMTSSILRELKPGDYVVHIDHGVGQFSGLETLNIGDKKQEAVRLKYRDNDLVYVGINSLHKLSKFRGSEGLAPKLSKIGSDAWNNLKRKAKKKVKDMADELIKLYAQRRAAKGFAFPEDGYLQNELEASFIYEDTPDQLKATNDVKEDMTKPYPMDRLICGDVGFGKTEVALRAAFKAVVGGKQVAVLVPTTILALQHYKTFSDRLKEFGVTVDYVNRFRTAAQKTDIGKRLSEGKIDIIIGTVAILGKKMSFKDLGLLIVDEEQKFGVGAKEKLRQLKINVDTLVMTATPIPRTLQFSLLSARDLSVIRTPPPNRQPIHTENRVFNEDLIKDAIYYEIERGGQVYFVHNRVKNLDEIAGMIQRLCPDVKVTKAHGQMDAKLLESTLTDFIEGEYEVLVCTNIIETGLDISNVNTIMINNAHQFGMSDLHQLRGRVGRSNKKAFCYLFSPPLSVLTSDARKRLQTLEEFSELGSGFEIAMRDLDIRGAGNLLGSEQSGFIADIGYETFQRILEEAVQELKTNDYKEMFAEQNAKKEIDYVRDVTIDADVEMLIPPAYVAETQERFRLYNELDRVEDEAGIEAFRTRLRDRFGPVPKEVDTLFEGLRLRWVAKKLGLERIILKGGKLRGYFVEDPQSLFYETERFGRVMQYIAVGAGQTKGMSLKKTNRHLILVRDNVRTLPGVRKLLGSIYQGVSEMEGIT